MLQPTRPWIGSAHGQPAGVVWQLGVNIAHRVAQRANEKKEISDMGQGAGVLSEGATSAINAAVPEYDPDMVQEAHIKELRGH